MRKTRSFYLITLVLALLSFGLMYIPVKAQVSDRPIKNGFSISPPSFDIKALPGDSIQDTIKIENISSESLTLSPKVKSFVAYGSEGQIQVVDEDTTYSINSWITFEKPKLTVEPGQIALFNFSINIPKDAQPGSHFGSLVFSTNAQAIQATAANVIQEIGAVLLIKLPGDVTEAANLDSFKSAQNTFTEPSVTLDTTVSNTGSVIVQPSGTITIEDIFGNVVKTVDVLPKNILPGSQRTFDQQFDFDRVGFFKAKLELNYGTAKTLSGETSFVALYTQRLIPVALLILVLIVLYIVFRKRINKALRVIVKG